MTATAAIEHIVSNFTTKMVQLYGQVEQAERAMDAYAAMDRAQQDVLKYVRATVGQLAQANAAHMAQADFLRMSRNKVFQLAIEQGCTAFTAEELAGASGAGQQGGPRDERPVAVGVAVDSRFKFGRFTHGVARLQLPFVGWSMVVHSRFSHSRLEPTFWRNADRQAVTESELMLQGIQLQQLL